MTNLNKESFFFFTKDINEIEIAPNSIEHAYLNILCDNLDASYKIFSSIDTPRANWGRIIVSMFKDGYLINYPTFFQIRNFFEIDLDFLLKNNKIDYVERLLGALGTFAEINQEIYKFAGRVMYENKLYTAALNYMEESKKIFYNDPELHYMLAKYYFDNHNSDEAYFYINECLKLLPSYYPAQIFKKQIEEILN